MEENFDSFQDRTLNTGDAITIPVIEEQVKIGKKEIETAKVKISKIVTEDVNSYSLPYLEDQVMVERIPKNVLVDTVPAPIRYEGDVMILSVLKEVAVVEKRMMLVEELHITRNKVEKSETHEISLRREEIIVNRTEISNPS